MSRCKENADIFLMIFFVNVVITRQNILQECNSELWYRVWLSTRVVLSRDRKLRGLKTSIFSLQSHWIMTLKTGEATWIFFLQIYVVIK